MRLAFDFSSRPIGEANPFGIIPWQASDAFVIGANSAGETAVRVTAGSISYSTHATLPDLLTSEDQDATLVWRHEPAGLQHSASLVLRKFGAPNFAGGYLVRVFDQSAGNGTADIQAMGLNGGAPVTLGGATGFPVHDALQDGRVMALRVRLTAEGSVHRIRARLWPLELQAEPEVWSINATLDTSLPANAAFAAPGGLAFGAAGTSATRSTHIGLAGYATGGAWAPTAPIGPGGSYSKLALLGAAAAGGGLAYLMRRS